MSVAVGVEVIPSPPLDLTNGLVDQAEAAGLESVWVPDHLMAWFAESVWPDVGNVALMTPTPHVYLDPMPLIASWAARTERIRFGTAVTEPIRRPPGQLANTALTLAHITGGRFVLGIGCGEAENCLPYGLPFDKPVSRLEEALVIIRRLWEDGRVTYEGRFWSLRDAVCRIGAYDGRFPEIWVGAHGPRMLEITGRHGDGWVPHVPLTAESYAEKLAVVHRAAEDAGRDPAAIVPSYNTPVCLADDHDIAHAMLMSEAMRQYALVFDQEFFARLGVDHPLGIAAGVSGYIPEWLSERELRAALERVPDPMLAHDISLHGTPHDVATQIKGLADAGLRHISVIDSSPFTDISQMPGAIDRVAELARLLA